MTQDTDGVAPSDTPTHHQTARRESDLAKAVAARIAAPQEPEPQCGLVNGHQHRTSFGGGSRPISTAHLVEEDAPPLGSSPDVMGDARHGRQQVAGIDRVSAIVTVACAAHWKRIAAAKTVDTMAAAHRRQWM